MGYMAKWGTKEFLVSANKIIVLEGLSTSLTLKEDSENDTSGTQPTNTRGRELRPISFRVRYLAAAGVNPREQIAGWEAELGSAYPLIIGGERFGAEKMKLTSVAVSDIRLSNSGSFLDATVTIMLEEYSEGKSSKLMNTSANGAASSSVSGNSTTEAAKKAALTATASVSDRVLRSSLPGREMTLK